MGPGWIFRTQGHFIISRFHRLREVACLHGFKRFEPAPVVTEDYEDVGLGRRRSTSCPQSDMASGNRAIW